MRLPSIGNNPPDFAVQGLENAEKAIRSARRFINFWLVFVIVCDMVAGVYVGFTVVTEHWMLLIGAGTFAGLSAAGFLRRETSKLFLREAQGWRDHWREYHR